MKPPFNSDEVVAERTFDSEKGPIALRLHRPLPWPSDSVDREPDWVCWYSISFPDAPSIQRSTAGVDSVQALLLAFAAARGNLLYVGNGTPERRPPVRWLDDDDLGLTINHFE